MTPEEAVLVAVERCVTASSLLAVTRLPAGSDDGTVARTLAAGVVCGWADHTSAGSADARGITVRERGGAVVVPVRWIALAAAIRPALRDSALTQHLADTYTLYARATGDTTVAGRLTARATAAELAQVRRQLLDRCHAAAPVQQSLFPPPPTRGRDLA